MPKVELTDTGLLALVGIVGAGVLAFWLYSKYRSGLLDPASPDNVAYQGAGSIVASVTGGAETTVGGVFARAREWFSGDDARIRDMLKGNTPTQGRVTTLAPDALYFP